MTVWVAYYVNYPEDGGGNSEPVAVFTTRAAFDAWNVHGYYDVVELPLDPAS